MLNFAKVTVWQLDEWTRTKVSVLVLFQSGAHAVVESLCVTADHRIDGFELTNDGHRAVLRLLDDGVVMAQTMDVDPMLASR